ncbi:mechanosensitive ion channel family protein [Chitinophaga lutea]
MEWTKIIFDKLHRWLEAIIRMLPNIALAALIMAIFYLLARLLRKVTYRIACRISDKPVISGLISGTINFIILAVGFFMALEVLKLDKAVTSLLAGAGIIGLTLGFAFQDLTANFISGIYITFRKPLDVGHVIETNGFTGTVSDIKFRSTTMRTHDGLHIIIPNKDIFQKPIINHSLSDQRKIELNILLPFNKQPPPVLEEMTEVVRQAIPVSERDPEVWFVNIEGTNLKLMVTAWVDNNTAESYNEARHRLIMAVLDALRGKQLLP